MFAAEDDLRELRWLPTAQRYETGSLAYALFHAWTAGLELVLDVGVDAIHARVLALTWRLIEGLREAGMTVVTPAACADERSAIVSFTAGSAEANQALLKRLTERHVAVSLRGGRIRVSPGLYNIGDDIDRLLEGLREV
jgi:selenocysteine lyase/cysteine desulfurase